MSDEDDTLSVDEFVEYCRTQAGLLSGSVETMGSEADALLDEIDEGMAEVRTRLDGAGDARGTATAQSPGTSDEDRVDVAAIEDLEGDIEEKQTLVEAKRVRMEAFQGLAADYTDLAEELRSDVESGREAMERVVRFEAERRAPDYFDERETVYEAAAASHGSDPEDGPDKLERDEE